ncbi:MAG: ATP-dependent DNA helicase [Desulfococcaceae bacterium]|jgi:ATP-dependent DNA helicase DinG|nr:ATP-dependent DNA helicase [Desulfococcaceae bacterium]
MLKLFDKNIDDIAFVYAHCGRKADGGNRVFAVAAKRICRGGDEKIFASPVRYAHAGGRERYIANLNPKHLKDAPRPGEVSEKLRHFLKDLPFVFLSGEPDCMEEIRLFCGSPRITDCGFAAEFFLPFSRTSKNLWEYLHGKSRDKISFSASEGMELSVDLVRHICSAVLNSDHTVYAPVLRYYLKKSRCLFAAVFLHINRYYPSYFGGLFHPFSDADTDNWRPFLKKASLVSHRDPHQKKEAFRPVSGEHVENLFRSLADAEKGFRFRPEQTAYARHISDALNERAVLTVEAGTGTGKTRGYLLPVLEYIRLNPKARVVISTYTKNLQEQIFQQELAAVREILPLYKDIRVALLKGKSAYICAEKLANLYDEEMREGPLLAWLYCLITVFHFRNAEADAAGERVRYYLNRGLILDRILHEASARSGCTPGHIYCPAQVMISEAWNANLVITNHHKLALLDNDAVLSGLFSNYIIDEANHFEAAVRSAFATEVGSRSIRDVLDYLYPRISDISKRAGEEHLQQMREAAEEMISLREKMQDFFALLRGISPGNPPGAVRALPYDHPVFQEGHISPGLQSMQDSLKNIRKKFEMIRDEDTCRMLRLQQRTARRIISHLDFLGEYAGALEKIGRDIRDENHITAYQLFRRNWIIMSRQVHVGESIRREIHQRKDCIVYTAATLCHKGRFDSFQQICGMDSPLENLENQASPKEFRFVAIPSPFARGNFEIIVPEQAVSGRYDNKEQWFKSLVMLLPDLIRSNQGRTLVLFSSYGDLQQIAEKVGEIISDTKFPLLIQKPGQSTLNLCDEFRSVKESVLFGVDTFWYGVDFKGDTLTQVIITRIPYPPPSDPLQMARKKIMSPKQYWERYRYDTDIKMRQGIGRLIRCDTDKGKVIILDDRYRGNAD